MAKAGKKAADAGPAPKEGATLSIDVDTFVRTRDSVVTGLATLQDAIQTLSSAYIKHTNAVLGEHGAGLDVETALSRLGENPLLGGLGSLRAASPPKDPAPEDKKEKKKRFHDPNQPKRPLTPYFLYMQTARPIIAEDLGPEVAKGAVSAEGVRRWNAMAPADKMLWTNAYTDNLKLYHAKMHSYKHGNLLAKDMGDEEAAAYAETHNVQVGPPEPTAEGQLTAEALHEAPVEEVVEEPVEATPAPRTPKAKAGGRKSKGKATPAEAAPAPVAPIVPAPSSAIVPPAAKPTPAAASGPEKEKSPDRKRKRASKKGKEADEPVASIEKEEAAAAAAAAETPKASDKKPRKKKAKSDA